MGSLLVLNFSPLLKAAELSVYLGPLTDLPGSSFSFEYQVRKHLKDKKVEIQQRVNNF